MKARKIVLSGLFIGIGLLLPMIFHQFNMGGPAFLPMHIPVLIGAMFLGPIEGLAIGMITPILSSVLTGMPVLFPMLPIMIFELGFYGLTSGLLSKSLKVNTYVSLISSMVVGRIVAGVVVFVLIKFFGFKGASPFIFVKGAILTGMPGILIQLVAVPPIVNILRRQFSRI